jgi:hypothetical protein
MNNEITLSELETIIKNKHIRHIGYQPNVQEEQESEMTLIIYITTTTIKQTYNYIKKHKDIIGIAYTLNYYIRAYSGMSIPEHLISLLQNTTNITHTSFAALTVTPIHAIHAIKAKTMPVRIPFKPINRLQDKTDFIGYTSLITKQTEMETIDFSQFLLNSILIISNSRLTFNENVLLKAGGTLASILLTTDIVPIITQTLVSHILNIENPIMRRFLPWGKPYISLEATGTPPKLDTWMAVITAVATIQDHLEKAKTNTSTMKTPTLSNNQILNTLHKNIPTNYLNLIKYTTTIGVGLVAAYAAQSHIQQQHIIQQTTISEIKNLNTNTQILTKNIETLIEKQTEKNLMEDMRERIQSQIKDTSIKAFIEKVLNRTNTP